mgnify:FL=1
METTDKKCNFFKSIVRYNTGLAAEIAGPVTGFPGLRVKRINFKKGRLLMWERGEYDVFLDSSDISFVRVVGYNFPILKGSNGITYATYVDVMIDGKINRMRIRTASVAKDAIRSKKYFEGSTPVVSGWIKDPSNPKVRDDHFQDPLCPPGYHPLVEEYVVASLQHYFNSTLSSLGIANAPIGSADYIMKDPYRFDSLDEPSSVENFDSQFQENTNVSENVSASAVETPALSGGKYDELLELKKLLDAGIISESDYEYKKNEILGIKKTKTKKKTNITIKPLYFILFLVGLAFAFFAPAWLAFGRHVPTNAVSVFMLLVNYGDEYDINHVYSILVASFILLAVIPCVAGILTKKKIFGILASVLCIIIGIGELVSSLISIWGYGDDRTIIPLAFIHLGIMIVISVFLFLHMHKESYK